MEFVELEEPFGRQRCQNFVVADAVVAAVVPRLRLSGLPSAEKKQNTVPSIPFLWRIQWPILIRGKTCSHRDREGQSKVPVAAANISRRCFRGGAAAAGVAPSLTWCSESPSPYCSCWTDRAHCVRPRRGRRRRRETRRSPPAEGSRSDGGKNKNMEK